MSVKDLGTVHFSPQDEAAIDSAIAILVPIIKAKAPSFNAEERKEYGSINEQNKLFADKVMDFYKTFPHLASPDVDWAEFVADYESRKFAETRLMHLANLVYMLGNIKISHDYDNYQASLTDYDYTQYKVRKTTDPDFHSKGEELNQFFKGGRRKPKEEDNNTDSEAPNI